MCRPDLMLPCGARIALALAHGRPYHRRVADRVLIYGVTGSGKTTLARQVADRTGLPWYSVDDLTWEPGWVIVPPAEQRRRIAAICAGEQWILDTAYGKWLDVVLPRAELILGLDYPRWRSLSRLTRRTVMRAIDHRQICNGNTESFRQAFLAPFHHRVALPVVRQQARPDAVLGCRSRGLRSRAVQVACRDQALACRSAQ